MSEEISSEEIAALLARESMSKEMTREEKDRAIRELQNSINVGLCPDIESRKVAIKALSQQTEDAISRQAAIEAIYDNKNRLNIAQAIRELPSVTPKQRMGHWEWLTEDKYRCSNCNHETRVDECMNKPMYDFCPFCNTKMESEEQA